MHVCARCEQNKCVAQQRMCVNEIFVGQKMRREPCQTSHRGMICLGSTSKIPFHTRLTEKRPWDSPMTNHQRELLLNQSCFQFQVFVSPTSWRSGKYMVLRSMPRVPCQRLHNTASRSSPINIPSSDWRFAEVVKLGTCLIHDVSHPGYSFPGEEWSLLIFVHNKSSRILPVLSRSVLTCFYIPVDYNSNIFYVPFRPTLFVYETRNASAEFVYL